ncbi:FG-GAP-like repeat-containing protein [Silanimonas sp.]|jgi:hypothetical protein|uniref:FG-GAP-like repeat-containing protein n=1 Tax=Silanimonas sp. TaxID=1929290 RepID=UPI0037CB6585
MSPAFRSLALCFSLLMATPAWSGTPPFDAEEYLRFSASESSIAMESGAGQLNWPENFTLEAWVYPTAASPFGVIAGRVAANRGADPFYNVVLAFEGQDGLTPAFIQTTGQAGTYRDVRASQPLPLYQWTHLAATRQGTELRLFVDGVQVATGSSAGPSHPSPGVPFAIGAGARGDGTGPQCCGSSIVVRNVKIWNRALNGAEVQGSAAADSYVTQPADLVRFWPINEGTGTTLTSAITGAPALVAGASDGRSVPRWSEAAFLRPLFRASSETITARSSAITDLWPVRIGQDTHFLGTNLIWPPTFPETTAAVSMLSPSGTRLLGSSEQRLIGSPLTVHVRDSVAFDANGDGRQDIVLADHGTDTAPFPGGVARLFMQQADGRFADETTTRLPGPVRFHHGVAAGDFDRDGDEDIFFCSFTQLDPAKSSAVMRNDGQGNFQQTSAGTLPNDIERGYLRCLIARTIDVDRDGDLDIVASLYRPAGPNDPQERHDRILVNNGAGRFSFAPEDTLPRRRPSEGAQTAAITVADMDGDGIDDIVAGATPDYRDVSVLHYYRGRGDGTFEDRTADLPNKWPLETWIYDVNALDFDGDGRRDLFVRMSSIDGNNPGPYVELLLNRGRDWIPMGVRAGLDAVRLEGRTAVPVDVDRDGDVDVAFAAGLTAGYLLRERPFPTNFRRPAHALSSGTVKPLVLNAGETHEHLYIDVPPTAREVRFETTSAQNVDLYLSRRPFSSSPNVLAAPRRTETLASGTTPSGNEVLVVSGSNLSAGRWYLTPVNPGGTAADLTVKATITNSTTVPAVAAGHFYNPSRGGHGVSYEYVSGQRVLIWYTYLEDGTPVWYYAQDFAPSPNLGTWSAPLLRFQWYNGSNLSRTVGSVRVTELGKQGGSDRIVFSWNLNGESGSETMERLGGVGCPAGYEGNNGLWFAPTLSGYGYTVTFFPDYEFIPVYLYDGRGNPRWLTGEKAGFTSTDTAIPLGQARGFCPLCDRTGNPVRSSAGTMTRRFNGSRISGLALNAQLASPLSGTWVQDRPVSLLTDPSPCVVP